MAFQYAMSTLGGLFSGNSAQKSLEDSLALQTHQYKLSRKFRRTSFQDTRESLEAADYNPLLAVGQQAQGQSFGASLSQTAPETERLNNILALAQLHQQSKLNSAQAYNQYQQGKLTTAHANQLISQAQLNSAQTSLTNLQSNAQAINNLHLPNMLKSQIRLNNNTAQAQLINAASNKASAQASLMNAKTNQIVGNSTSWRNYNASLGYTSSVGIGPIKYSHTGNSLGRNNSGKQSVYKTEYINGKPVRVRIIN